MKYATIEDVKPGHLVSKTEKHQIGSRRNPEFKETTYAGYVITPCEDGYVLIAWNMSDGMAMWREAWETLDHE